MIMNTEDIYDDLKLLSEKFPPAQAGEAAFAQVGGEFYSMKPTTPNKAVGDNIKSALVHTVTHEAHVAIDKILDDLENASVDSAVLSEQLATMRKANSELRKDYMDQLHNNDVLAKENHQLCAAMEKDDRAELCQRLTAAKATISKLEQRNTNQQGVIQNMRGFRDQSDEIDRLRAEVAHLLADLERVKADAIGHMEDAEKLRYAWKSRGTVEDLNDALAMADNRHAHDAETIRQLRDEVGTLRVALWSRARLVPQDKAVFCTDQSIIDRRDSRPVGERVIGMCYGGTAQAGTAFDIVGPSC